VRLIVAISLLLCVFNLNAQTYTYSYTDPCTGKLKTINVPINGTVTVSYYGEVNNFSANDFSNGTFETWTNNVTAQYQNISPCSQIVGVTTAVNVTQSQVINTLSVLGSLSSLADIAGATNILGGTTSTLSGTNNTENGNGNGGNNNRNNNNGSSNPNRNVPNGTGSGTTGQTTTTTQSTETTGSGTQSSETTSGGGTVGGSGSEGGSGSQGGSGSSGQGSGGEETTTQTTETTPQETGGKTNITAGSTNTIKSSTTTTTNKGKDGNNGKPSVVASSDFVGFNFKNSDVTLGAKLTAGYTALRWDGARSWGGLLDYTSALKGPNITGFYAWIKNKNVALMSGTLTLGFEGTGSIYGTVSGGYMQSFKRIKQLKMVYMGTASYGQVFRTKFLGTAVIVGGMMDVKVGKRLAIKLTDLMVYSPYVSYYNDIVMQSPYVMLPSIGVNIGITKKFKFNINGGGAWSLGQSTLNYTITSGMRLMI
jgi:hypothetical protein